MVMARQLLKSVYSGADLRVLGLRLVCTGRLADELGGPYSCPDCPVNAGYFPSFPGAVLNPCWD